MTPSTAERAPQRILVIRLDRIGDVVLSLPVVQALRTAFPSAHLAMVVPPVARELVATHPALDAVFVYDKAGEQREWWATWRFARTLRRERFDAAVILHPTRRAHWMARLAGIPRRIGYARKGAWLLTDRRPHEKRRGQRHEAEYALELLQPLGVTAALSRPLVVVDEETEAAMGRLLDSLGRDPARPLVAFHPSASCASKRWAPERFAAVADALVEQAGAQIVLIAGPDDAAHAERMRGAMRHPPIDLSGRLSTGELAAALSRCRALVSNDSGPVHVAAAVGTPVVAIFGRNEAGLGPRRWGPLGAGHAVLQKAVGCDDCLAHRCRINFLCLQALSVPEVLAAALRLLSTSK
jgi:lipopolysaccharide heptosyltransferase II